MKVNLFSVWHVDKKNCLDPPWWIVQLLVIKFINDELAERIEFAKCLWNTLRQLHLRRELLIWHGSSMLVATVPAILL